MSLVLQSWLSCFTLFVFGEAVWFLRCRSIQYWRKDVSFTIMRALLWFAVIKEELSKKANLLIYLSVHFPTFTFCHKEYIMTERTSSQIQATEMSFLVGWRGLSLRSNKPETHRSSMLNGVSWGGLSIWLRCLLGTALSQFSVYILLGGKPKEDQEFATGMIHFMNFSDRPEGGEECHWGMIVDSSLLLLVDNKSFFRWIL